jgi:hypothetical protein
MMKLHEMSVSLSNEHRLVLTSLARPYSEVILAYKNL